MYPSLIAAGGLATLAYDYRHKAKEWSTRWPIFRCQRMPGPRMTNDVRDAAVLRDDIELSHISRSVPVRETDAGLHRRSNAGQGHTSRTPDQIRRSDSIQRESTQLPLLVPSRPVALAFGTFLIMMLIVCLFTRSQLTSPPRELNFMTNMIIAGLIIFGGGPVVIPLLRGYTVENGWISSRDFLLGFAILQAFPGPNFNFAAYLGILACPARPVLGALLGWFGIFSPGIMLKLALLPVYNSWRKLQVAKSVLRGLNAAAVGLIFTAVWQLFLGAYL